MQSDFCMPVMSHGTAKLKADLCANSVVLRHKGECGVITAFLPDIDVYAVMFDGKMGINNWFTMDSVSFEMYFDYTLSDNPIKLN